MPNPPANPSPDSTAAPDPIPVRPQVRLVSRGAHLVLLGGLGLIVLGTPLLQLAMEMLRPAPEAGRARLSITDFPAQGSIVQRLRGFESNLEDRSIAGDFYRETFRQGAYSVFHEGSHQVVRGRGNMLHFGLDVRSILNRNPMQPVPKSVAKEPQSTAFTSPAEAILDFAEQLRERGIQLLLVPIPVKASIYPESLGVEMPGPLTSPYQESLFARLREGGVVVLDLAPIFWEQRANAPLYLQRDTHWTPQGMELTAKIIADSIKTYEEFPQMAQGSQAFQAELRPQVVQDTGDLARMLGLPADSPDLTAEVANAKLVIDQATGQVVAEDPGAPIVLLGDSFANIYSVDSDQLEWEWGSGAGLPEHIMANLGVRIENISVNGGGANGVRARLRERHGSLPGKKLVIWALSSRLLMLDQDGLAQLDVDRTWEKLAFPKTGGGRAETAAGTSAVEGLPEGAVARVRARVTALPEIPQPGGSPYPEMLIEVNCTVEEVLAGSLAPGPIITLHWAYRNRQVTANIPQVGQELELLLAAEPPREFATAQRQGAAEVMTPEGDFIMSYWPLESAPAAP